MTILLFLMVLSGLVELAVSYWLPSLRKVTTSLLLFAELILLVFMLALYGDLLWVDVLSLVWLYRLFNLYRLRSSRSNERFLQNVTRHTTLRLVLFQAVIAAGGLISGLIYGFYYKQWYVLALIQLALAVILLVSTLRHKAVSNRLLASQALADTQAPTLSVAIPARNETDNLYDCLVSLLACDYPKLEILVLDDNSTLKRTPEIIRSFAHDGVEFVAGKELPETGWLAKNWAYEQLAEAANGEYILFCGADTRFEPEALRTMVSIAVSRNKDMLSVVPRNRLQSGVQSGVLQPMRYAWEISLPRRWFKRPPVLSTCWLAKRQFLSSTGGFKAVSRRVVCESYFAREAIQHDGYSFFRYDGVQSLKPADEQLETAIRLRYPQLKRQPELVALLSVVELFGCLGSIASMFWGIVLGSYMVSFIGLLAFILSAVTFAQIFLITYRRKTGVAYLLWPIGFLTDIYLMNLSMWRYEFGNVLWKGRSVAPSVMYSDKS